MRDSLQRRKNRTAQRIVLLVLALKPLMPVTADAQIARDMRDRVLAALAREHHAAQSPTA